jgi:hypothetical protein
MKRINRGAYALFYTTVLITVLACGNPAGADLPFSPPDIPGKTAAESGLRVRALCYIDVDRYNPLNAGDYTLKDGTLFFDYVVLGAARVRHDSRGWYIDIPPSLAALLEKRNSITVPLQKKGIKVLLGITGGGDGISYESLTDDAVRYFSQIIKDVLDNYRLDGAEFYDKGAGKPGLPFYPNEADYANADEREKAWLSGGDSMNNLIYRLRTRFDGDSNKIILLREENYGRRFPNNVSGSAEEATFSGTAQQINYFINPRFDAFEPESANNDNAPFVYHAQYAPLAVNLGGDSNTAAVMPPIEDPLGKGRDITGYSKRFAEAGDYGLLYYHNLKAVSEAAREPYLAVPSSPGVKLTQAEYISITARAVFGQDVVCQGGNHQRTW